MVETALTLLATLAVILGTLDVGQIFMQVHFYNERARAAARWASVHELNVDNIKRWTVYGNTQTTSGNGYLGLSLSNVEVTVLGTLNTSSHQIQVKINKPVRFFSPWFPRSWSPPPATATSPAESLGASV